jgi:hypothetical protein
LPKRRTHKDVSLIVLGKAFPEVDKFMDWPSTVLGPSHRKVLHTIPQGFIVGLILTGDFGGAAAGVLHVIIDVADSGFKKEIRKLTKKGGEGK